MIQVFDCFEEAKPYILESINNVIYLDNFLKEHPEINVPQYLTDFKIGSKKLMTYLLDFILPNDYLSDNYHLGVLERYNIYLDLYNKNELTSEYDISKLFDVVSMVDKDLEMISKLIDDAIHYIENKQNEQEY